VSPVAEPLQLPAPSWAMSIDEADKDGITWRRVASVRPLVNDDVVGLKRSEIEIGVERADCIEVGDGFVLVQGPLVFFIGEEWFDAAQVRHVAEAIAELLALVDAEGGAQ
jgi:hypothetical protein